MVEHETDVTAMTAAKMLRALFIARVNSTGYSKTGDGQTMMGLQSGICTYVKKLRAGLLTEAMALKASPLGAASSGGAVRAIDRDWRRSSKMAAHRNPKSMPLYAGNPVVAQSESEIISTSIFMLKPLTSLQVTA